MQKISLVGRKALRLVFATWVTQRVLWGARASTSKPEQTPIITICASSPKFCCCCHVFTLKPLTNLLQFIIPIRISAIHAQILLSYNCTGQLWYSLNLLTLFLFYAVLYAIFQAWPASNVLSPLLLSTRIINLFLLHDSPQVSSFPRVLHLLLKLLLFLFCILKTYTCYYSPSRL